MLRIYKVWTGEKLNSLEKVSVAYCLNARWSVVNLRSMLHMNNIGSGITEDLGYTLRIGSNGFNTDDALLVSTRTSGQKGLQFCPEFAQVFSTQESITAECFQSFML